MSLELFERHQEKLEQAIEASKTRGYWSGYKEMPSPRSYGETAQDDGIKAFQSHLGKTFEIDQPTSGGTVGAEDGPFGVELNVQYPAPDVEGMMRAAKAAMPAWRKLGAKGRAGVCMEILERLNAKSFEIAFSVMHTTGQAFMMSFQAGGAHAQDRGLEAVAYGYAEMARHPETTEWVKPQGKHDPLEMTKKYTAVGRGVALMVGCATFPTWNGYPGLFASLVTGNAVIVKPHPRAVLPLAITVRVIREVLSEVGIDPNLVCLAVDTLEAPITKEFALHQDTRVIDFTGSSEFGNWLEDNAKQAQVYTEKAGVNAIIIDDFDDIKGIARNLSFTFSLYSGQMCTTPQNIFIPKDGIEVNGEKMSFDNVASAIAGGVEKFLSVPERAVEVLGAVQNKAILDRMVEAKKMGDVVLDTTQIDHPMFKGTQCHTPVIIKLDGADVEKYSEEVFGPIVFLIATENTEDSIAKMGQTISENGAITLGLYSKHENVIEAVEEAALDAGVNLSINLTGGVFVNQSAAFSDFHATGANPAANAALTDGNFVSGRFRVMQSRR
ncbi:phenylacetic acid degradation protein PaaN [Terasakiella sp. A23]|uniref:phenylacetic acid degradation protein PaaN n=1 Tax=Terasakiella sp. FCG-A23 TaxID=3080561 RepID=UPI002954DD83|nr:phenylacetic acid degradation protein PaaN [Terasakiella sp. A23]MDV7339536.1 phenylacetic acid degradation protein PaaN [Terasakiella sp. A23]